MEIPAIRFFEDRALGAQFWVTIVSITTSGALKHEDSNFDIKGLRITRKKAIVVEFWIGRTDIPSDGTDGVVSSEQVKDDNMIEADDETTSKDNMIEADDETTSKDKMVEADDETTCKDKKIEADDEPVITSNDDEAKTKATDDNVTEVKAEETTTTGNDEKKEEDSKDKSNDAVTRECLNSFMEQIKNVLIEELSDNLRVPDVKFSVQQFHA